MAVNISLSLVHKCAPIHQKHISTATDTLLQSVVVNPTARPFFTLGKYHADTQMCVSRESERQLVCMNDDRAIWESGEEAAFSSASQCVWLPDWYTLPLNFDTFSWAQTLEMPAWIPVVHFLDGHVWFKRLLATFLNKLYIFFDWNTSSRNRKRYSDSVSNPIICNTSTLKCQKNYRC